MLRFCRRLGPELVAAGFTVAILGAIAHADAGAPPPAPAPAAQPAAPPAAAAAPPAAAEVQIDIIDAASPSTRFAGVLAIAAGDCGSLETGAPASLYHVKVCFNGRDSAPR